MNERDKLIRATVYADIDLEREQQDEGVGHEFDDKNTPSDWVTFIVRETSEAATATEDFYSNYRTGMVRAAAICVAAIEAFDRSQGTVARHYEELL